MSSTLSQAAFENPQADYTVRNNVKPRLSKRIMKYVDAAFCFGAGVAFDTVTTTDDAMAALHDPAKSYAFVISDIQRGRDDRAGYGFLQRVKDDGLTIPVIFYTRYTDPSHDTELRKLGAVGATNSPSKLIELVSGVLKREVPG